MAGFVHDAAKLGQRSVAEARAMLLHEQIAAAREQRAPAAGAQLGMEEQAADFGRAFEVGGQRQRLVAEGLAELRAASGSACSNDRNRRAGSTPTWPNTWQVPRIMPAFGSSRTNM